MPRRLIAWWTLPAGILAAGGQAPVSLWLLALAGFSLLALAHLRSPSPRAAALAGWRFGFGYFAAALLWIVEPFMVDAAHDGWMAPFALILLSGGLALFWALALYLARRVAPRGALAPALAFAAALTLSEALRGWIFTGFPWSLIGQNLIPSPILPLAALAGPHALSLALLLPAAAFGAALSRRQWRPALTGAALLAALLLLSPLARPLAPPAGPGAPIVRLVQPNAPQREKWDSEKSAMFFRRQLDYSSAAPTPDLIVWPETAIPYLLDQNPGLPAMLSRDANGAPLAVGINRSQDGRYYNSLAVIGPDATLVDLYDKHHLVPFGEYIPFGDLLAKLGITAFAAQTGHGFSAGPGPHLITIPGVGTALPLICYEAVFPRDIRNAPARPDLLLQITNDAWFGTFSGPYQHLAQARLRSVEQGLPMIRVANTGISALIAADGTVLDALPLGQAGYLDVALPSAAPATPYARHGDLPALLAAFLALALSAALAFMPRSAPGHKAIDHPDPQS
ncbi:apolipoprotein N-acyltransferase [Pseudooceanicola sediminis]|mgnify:CR=1 FL=1|uniref:Apolipoprotein N-acyltransferase n=1 Tax=Pseudooceanicola sediminis TaxID=2211117 RepID=A0A399IXY5_9RHOB|nr:apolipoprotein N-acyltransferase [Pseudooceanicola sediminis]RII37965.1 apolipoprotein N-acyltransferase [Pseudooceanicola sediminis]|tara:strand:- start:1068 stop:2597 length:1530 start_codon:yes stop_codon:yes gene_type:complete